MLTCNINFTPPGGVYSTQLCYVRRAVGFDTPDSFELFPGIQHKDLGGTVTGQTSGFRRLITLDIGVITDLSAMKGVLYFLMDDNRTVDYLTESGIHVELVNPKEYKNIWLNGSRFGKKNTLELMERSIRQTFPL